MALAIVAACRFVYLMDVFLLNVSSPRIQAEFGGSAVLKTVFAANQIAFASFVFLGGRLGDLFGRPTMLMIGLAGAGRSALLAGFGDSAATLVAARTLPGAFAAFFVPQVMAILVSLFDQHERARAVSVYGMVIGFGGVAGFLSGGLLLEYASEGVG